ncbi:MAG: bifunctional folylpolyglutamate synthase/dihydrofolate synthase [Clostridiales bacterium]|nr:bifunctional folylpolyglutamate synthase/dihydrofolate synthase [Clostridiales bacterium]
MPDNGTPKFINDSLKFGIKPGLERISVLLDRLDNPQDSIKCIHIAGTNGKGSVAAFCAYCLATSGLKTGLFTSPFLLDFSERIRILEGDDLEGMIPSSEVARLSKKVEKASRGLIEAGDPPTEFELVTAMCFLWFAEQNVDVAVMETGLGGRFDSTNIIRKPEVTVICSIGKDHESRLGNTVREIAFEKAGIIKTGSPVVCMSPDLMMTLNEDERHDVYEVMSNTASQKDTTISFAGDDELIQSCEMNENGFMTFEYGDREYSTRLNGTHQAANAALAIEAMKIFGLGDDKITEGIYKTHWNCRFEIWSKDPVVIFDGGHNPQGAASFANTYNKVLAASLASKPLRMVIGAMEDKDIDGIIEAYHRGGLNIKEFICVRPDNPRSISPVKLSQKIKFVYNDTDIITCDDRYEGAKIALRSSEVDGMPLVVTGSLYLVGDIRSHMKGFA